MNIDKVKEILSSDNQEMTFEQINKKAMMAPDDLFRALVKLRSSGSVSFDNRTAKYKLR